jgi:hypothetical protein
MLASLFVGVEDLIRKCVHTEKFPEIFFPSFKVSCTYRFCTETSAFGSSIDCASCCCGLGAGAAGARRPPGNGGAAPMAAFANRVTSKRRSGSAARGSCSRRGCCGVAAPPRFPPPPPRGGAEIALKSGPKREPLPLTGGNSGSCPCCFQRWLCREPHRLGGERNLRVLSGSRSRPESAKRLAYASYFCRLCWKVSAS